MARTPRPLEEVKATRRKIIENALDIISKHGYEGFTLRGLAKRLGIAAPGIYYYYKNKEEVFLSARREGFLLVGEMARKIAAAHDDPFCRLKAHAKGHIDFALRYRHYYNIMYTLEVPNYPAFVGTPLQEAAYKVVEASEPTKELMLGLMETLAEEYDLFPKEEARTQFMLYLSGMHGIVSLYNNNTLKRIHECPADVIHHMTDRFLSIFRPPDFRPDRCKCFAK